MIIQVVSPEILKFYQRGGERRRLSAGPGRLEFLRIWDVLMRELPAAPARVCDVGGATGVYAGPLAEAGYQVHVVDPVPEYVAEAGELPGVTATVGDGRELPVADQSADAVLLFGPLYHLLERAERLAAWREAARVTRSGGLVVGAMINRFRSMFDGFARGYYDDPLFGQIVEHTLETGEHRNVHPDRTWFTSAYLHHPDEIPAEVSDAGLVMERLVSVESPLWLAGPRLEEILADSRLTGQLLDMLRRTEEEPSLLGASAHLLAIARSA